MYIAIFEDSTFKLVDEICKGDLESINKGILQLIDPDNLKELTGKGEWVDIPVLNTEFDKEEIIFRKDNYEPLFKTEEEVVEALQTNPEKVKQAYTNYLNKVANYKAEIVDLELEPAGRWGLVACRYKLKNDENGEDREYGGQTYIESLVMSSEELQERSLMESGKFYENLSR